jgi:hypothetical protein
MYQISYKNVTGCLFEVNWILYVQVTIFITFLKNNRLKIDLLLYINVELWDLDDISMQV